MSRYCWHGALFLKLLGCEKLEVTHFGLQDWALDLAGTFDRAVMSSSLSPMLDKSLGHELLHRFSDLVLAQRTKFLIEKRLLFLVHIDGVENTFFICHLKPRLRFDRGGLGVQSVSLRNSCVGRRSIQVCRLQHLSIFQMRFTLYFLQRSMGLGLSGRFVLWGPPDGTLELQAVLCADLTHVYALNLSWDCERLCYFWRIPPSLSSFSPPGLQCIFVLVIWRLQGNF